MSEVKPFSPQDAFNSKEHIIPSFVIEAVNTLLSSRYKPGRSVTMSQKEVLKAARDKAAEQTGEMPTADTFFDKKWLDFEPIYEKQGWKVTYDRPAYNESYEPSWCFEALPVLTRRRA